jgi:hypothetical protein
MAIGKTGIDIGQASETKVSYRDTTRRNNTEELDFRLHHRKNLGI